MGGGGGGVGGGCGGWGLRGGQYGEGKGAYTRELPATHSNTRGTVTVPEDGCGGGGGGGYSLCSWGTDCWGTGIEPSWFVEPSWPRCSMLELLIMPYFDIRSRGEAGRGGGGGGYEG